MANQGYQTETHAPVAAQGYEHFIELISTLPRAIRFASAHKSAPCLITIIFTDRNAQGQIWSRAIRWLNVSYSIWFNKKHQRVGPLFHGVVQGHPAQLFPATPDGAVASLFILTDSVVALGWSRAPPAGVRTSGCGQRGAAQVGALRAYSWSSYRYYNGEELHFVAPASSPLLELLRPGRRAITQTAAYRKKWNALQPGMKLETDLKTGFKASLLLGEAT